MKLSTMFYSKGAKVKIAIVLVNATLLSKGQGLETLGSL